MVLFPYAGAGPSAFRDWRGEVPANVDLIAAAYPGRELRAREPLHSSLGALADEIAGALLPLSDIPSVLFGHSMGAYVAYEVAQRLAAAGTPPRCLVVSAARSPTALDDRFLRDLPDGEFLESLAKLNGFAPEILASPAMMDLALPVLRADISTCETHRFGTVGAMRLPIVACAGRLDERAPPAAVRAWHALAGPFEFIQFDGDHFFLRQEAGTLTRLLASRMQPHTDTDVHE